MQEKFDGIFKKIWVTRGARFQAHKRLNVINNWSTWSVNLLSIYVVCLSILALAPPTQLSFLADKMGTLLIICFSVLMLVVNLLESSKDYKLKADVMHRCAKELSHLYNELILIKDQSSNPNINDKLVEILNKYQVIIDNCSDNHLPIDVEKFKVENSNEFEIKSYNAFWINVKYFFQIKGVYLLVIVMPLVVFLARFFLK